MAIGILAYGSVLDEPGEALIACTVRVLHDVITPFAVEFARSSHSRDGAPTLTPVAEGGAPVPAGVLVLEPRLDIIAAKTLLYRRETRRNSASATNAKPSWIRCVRNFAGVELCLYAALNPNIRDLKPKTLAKLAVASAARSAGAHKQDGISYLAAQLQRGIVTPLSESYRQAVLELVRAADLLSAWHEVRRSPTRFLRV